MTRFVVALVLVLALSTRVDARQLWATVGGGYTAPSAAVTDIVTLREYVEPGLVTTNYPGSGGMTVDAGAHLTLRRGLGVSAGVGLSRRDSDSFVSATVPHPLFFSQSRRVDAVVNSGTRRELAVRAELTWTTAIARRVHLTLSGGPTLLRATQSFLTDVTIREEGYPFDNVALAPSWDDESAWGAGLTGAVETTWAATPRVALGMTGRFSRATASLRGQSVAVGGPSLIGAFKFRLR
jgi:hypothetical protein